MLNCLRNVINDKTLRIIIALGVSLLLHILVLSRPGVLSSADLAPRRSSLQISLAAPAVKSSSPSEPQVIRVQDTSRTPQEVKIPRKIEKPTRVPVAPEKQPEPSPVNAASVVAHSRNTKEIPQTNQSAGVPLPGLTGSVKRAEVEFEIVAGADRRVVGKGRHLYVSDDGDNYGVSIKQVLNSDKVGEGNEWQMDISGRIGRQGLNPLIFETQGILPERLAGIKGGSASSEGSGKVRKGRIPDGILDRQSLLYQFMVQPPALSGGKLWITDGVAHSLFTYRLGGTESMVIPAFGGVRALMLLFSTSESNETIELWLVPNLHYLPVKIRYTDRQGQVTEQVVTSLDFK